MGGRRRAAPRKGREKAKLGLRGAGGRFDPAKMLDDGFGPRASGCRATKPPGRAEQAEPCCWAGYMHNKVFELKFFFSEAFF